MFWAIECDGQWFCVKHNCWYPALEKDCIFDTKANVSFFYERWLSKELKEKATIVEFELKRKEK